MRRESKKAVAHLELKILLVSWTLNKCYSHLKGCFEV